MLSRVPKAPRNPVSASNTERIRERLQSLPIFIAPRAFSGSITPKSGMPVSEHHIREYLRLVRVGEASEQEIPLADRISVISAVSERFPELAMELFYSTGGKWNRSLDPSMRDLTLLICDRMGTSNSPRDLLALGEFSAGSLQSPDYAILSQVVNRAQEVLARFSPSEFVALLQLCSRLDFVDSDFNESVQAWLPTVVGRFADNQYPVIFASVLRLGIDQAVDRLPQSVTETPPSPLMMSLIPEIIKRVPNIAAPGCLTILHSIVRRPKTKISTEMESLVSAIAETARLDEWGLAMRIQAVHALSRLGIESQSAIASLFAAVNRESIFRIPSANLQHLLSVIHNHASHHDEKIWKPVLRTTMDRIGHPMIAKSMPMSTIAVTLGYLGRLGLKDETVVNQLLMVFAGAKPALSRKSLPDRISLRVLERILTDSQVDIAHLTGIVEAIDRLEMWHLPLAVPLALVTRRIVMRDGIHNIKATPLCQLTRVFLRKDFALTDTDLRSVDSVVDTHIDSVAAKGTVSTNWALQSKAEPCPDFWKRFTVLCFLEGLLKHEKYIRSTPSVVERCVELRDMIRSNTGLTWSDLPSNLMSLLDSVETPLE